MPYSNDSMVKRLRSLPFSTRVRARELTRQMADKKYPQKSPPELLTSNK